MNLARPARQIVVVAGTNGKGTCVAALYRLLLRAGISAGTYTSPHLLAFNERVSLNGHNASDEALCAAFRRIEAARGEISLTYFEFATLAALLLMEAEDLDVAILEVGLGGRLDAVNLVDADLAVVTSIALDHQEWLGSDLTAIAREKFAVGRPGKPLVVGDMPAEIDVEALAREQRAELVRLGVDFNLSSDGVFSTGPRDEREPVTYTNLKWGELPQASIACALAAWQYLRLPEEVGFVPQALADLDVPGRFQSLPLRDKTLLLDVAHNPAAAQHLAAKLRGYCAGRSVTTVFSVMADKDIGGIIAPLKPIVDRWLLPALGDVPRAANPAEIMPLLDNARMTESVDTAMTLALSGAGDLVLVCGSFYTVAKALAWRREETGGAEQGCSQ